MELTRILTKCWKYVKNNRALWFLGLLGVFSEGTSYFFPSFPSEPSQSSSTVHTTFKGYASPAEYFQHNPGVTLTLVVISVVVGLVVLYYSLSARAGLIVSVNALEERTDDASTLHFLPAFRKGKPFALRIFGVTLIVFFASVLFLLVFGLPIAFGFTKVHATGGLVALVLAAVVAFLLFLVGGVTLNVMSELAERYIVLEDMRVMASFQAAYGRFRARLNDVLISWLVSIGMKMVLGIGLVVCVAVSLLVAILVLGGIGLLIKAIVPFLAVLGVVFFFGLLMLLIGVISSFTSSYWTLVYRGVKS